MSRIIHLSGTARAVPAVRHIAGLPPFTPPTVDAMVQDTMTVDVLAGMLDRFMTAHTTDEGELDLRKVAADLIAEMRRNQR